VAAVSVKDAKERDARGFRAAILSGARYKSEQIGRDCGHVLIVEMLGAHFSGPAKRHMCFPGLNTIE
jgi:hypothetical protein